MSEKQLPTIDPKVRFVGSSKLRELNGRTLRDMRDRGESWVIQDHEQPMMVLVSYEAWMELQRQLHERPGRD